MAKKKIGKKVSCAACESYYNKFCTTKRVMVLANKKRSCDKFVYDKNKTKTSVPIPTTRITFKEKEMLKNEHKEDAKIIREKLKEGVKITPENILRTTDEKHPLTGDLSRFTTTGSKGRQSGNR